jgi:hypothetical protein
MQKRSPDDDWIAKKSSSGGMSHEKPMTVRSPLNWRNSAAAVLCIVVSIDLGACSAPLADLPVIGLPAGTPARPAAAGAYPAVHDVPTDRSEPMLDPTEQAKVENDLKTARDRQTKASEKAADR